MRKPFQKQSDNTQNGNPVLELLERYWREQRLWGTVPNRNRIDPTKIDMALPWTMMLRDNGFGCADIRVAGQMLHKTLGCDPRGQTLDAFFEQTSARTVNDAIAQCLRQPAIIHFPLMVPAGIIRSAQKGMLLLLPLANDNGDVSRLLGAIVGLNTSNRPVTMACDPIQSVRKIPLSDRQNQTGSDAKHPTLRLVINNS